MQDRIFAGVSLLLCIGLALTAWSYHAPFSYEPVGPRAFPLLLIVLIALGALYLLIKPSHASQEAREPALDRHVIRKIVLCVIALLIYAVLFELVGFIISSALFAIAMARLYEGTWKASLTSGVLLALGLYVLFDKALDVPLPLGLLSGLEF
ncbi:tripartite tricarboxylate transporter TctB family protein [Pseudomonas sp. CNPSo 3701]|uniref:tripartite tricarboxylate transporter TctB family protein n=1 Tax=Pseudomonas sp. CNPSo 3701 TaxID=3027943 RepID=UPI0023633F0E|nr:tripartite tricarboxylate transporter TctB family protein [Pseudomonas sp. CNPSo 3701]MDD1508691.1 tripartite tricarboxylate transporter TctB family protein [Pseudomonas sp. CNPSo 3701]